MLDIDGYLTSVEFLSQLAAAISAVLSAFFAEIIAMFFQGSAG